MPAEFATGKDSRSTDWIAADYCDDTLLLWAMRGDDVCAQLTLKASAGTEDNLRDLSDAAQKLLPEVPDAPIFVAGHPALHQSVPAQVAKPSGQPAKVDGRAIYRLDGLVQTAPVGRMDCAANRIAGFLSLNPNWDGVVCLPGATTHWVLISANEVVSFQSFLSVAMHRHLAPVLGKSAPSDLSSTADQQAFVDAMETALSRPEALAARLAELQADEQMPDSVRDARLWGLLLGAELAAARPYWLGQNVALIAPAEIEPAYMRALAHQGIPVTQTDAARMANAGLVAAWRAAGT
ncbi:2-dehydro-3-deoxygalactonokinase [Phaeobacter sp.]|uniref:2-dehydro-3-deoxygalactonokinase n=1 Tax=Phaeobacter sp. TaxID=1902409 RepID=UPI0025E14AA0|nr:2-dehydro-3-deoxygalactonokinase [Phaeobacter sp.]